MFSNCVWRYSEASGHVGKALPVFVGRSAVTITASESLQDLTEEHMQSYLGDQMRLLIMVLEITVSQIHGFQTCQQRGPTSTLSADEKQSEPILNTP